MIRVNGGFDRFKMIEVEKYPCKDKREALRREDEIMKELKASMNTIKSFLTEEERKKYRNEYLETNKEKIKEKGKQYREDNKYKINEKIICQCGSVIIRNSIKRHERTKKHFNLMK